MSRTLEIFADLVRIPSPPLHEARVAAYVSDRVRALGLRCREDGAARTLGGDSGNLIVHIPGTVPGTPVFFCAHLDTVPHTESIEPFVDGGIVRSAGDTILGADNKAAVAVILEAAARIVERDLPHAGAEFVFTVAEEIGCKGAAALQLDALEGPVGFVYDYVGNVGTYVASAPAGYLLSCDVTGRAAHAGLAPEDGRSAVDAAARAIASLRTGRLPAGETVNVGLVRGGSAHNVVAEHCSFVVDVRAPTQDVAAERVAEIVEACERAVSTNGCTLDVRRDEKYRAYGFDGGEPVLELALRALQACGHEPHGVVSGGGADANIFNASGRPCVNLANGMADVHTASEWIAVEALEQMVDVTLAVLEQARD